MEKYTTYENKPNKRVCIHKLPCDKVRQHGGLGEGLYKEFYSFDEAKNYAESLNDYKVEYCSTCLETN